MTCSCVKHVSGLKCSVLEHPEKENDLDLNIPLFKYGHNEIQRDAYRKSVNGFSEKNCNKHRCSRFVYKCSRKVLLDECLVKLFRSNGRPTQIIRFLFLFFHVREKHRKYPCFKPESNDQFIGVKYARTNQRFKRLDWNF